jgi:hypothetical protein
MLKTSINPSVYIIILNWNGYEDTLECVQSISKISYKNYKLVIVDNGSDTDEIDEIINDFPKTELIKSKKNLGFSGGNNVGIKIALEQNVDFILLLNNDTTVDTDTIEILLNKFETDESVGIVAPQINYYDEPNKIWSAGGKISKLRASGFAVSNKMEDELEKKDNYVDFVSGCCMLIKKEVIEKVGLFDENFFLYVEDTDLCYRTKNAGYKILVTSDTKIYHKGSQSTKKSSEVLPLYYTTRNRLYFAKKNFNYLFYVSFAYLTMSMIFKSLKWLINGNRKNIKAVKLAFRDFLNSKFGFSHLKI